MDEKKLLEFYSSFYGPLAGPWNLSPECLHFIYRHRKFLRAILKEFGESSDLNICNVGIGQGDWDLYLSFELGSRGKLTSIDRRSDCCETLRARLKIQEHPHLIDVINEDVNETLLPPESFDLLTAIGSTINESGKYDETLKTCVNLIKPGGMLFYSDFPKYHSLSEFFVFAPDHPIEILDVENDKNPDFPFYLILARRTSSATS